jgi:hopanoid-associated phosphorylase
MKSLGIVTGLASEAACLGKVQFCRVAGADAVRAGLAARALIAEGCLGLLSFGLAGGLDPNLEPGAVIVADAVVGPQDRRLPTDVSWRAALADKLHAHVGPLLSMPTAIVEPEAKEALRGSSGALAVDMESLAIALVASEANLPFAAIRAVADPATARVPAWVMAGVRSDGSVHTLKIARELVKRPGDLPTLLRLAGYSRVAHQSLSRVAMRLGPSFGFPVAFSG